MFQTTVEVLNNLLYRDTILSGFTVSSSLKLRKPMVQKYSKSDAGRLEVVSIQGIPKLNRMVKNKTGTVNLSIQK